MQCLYSKDGPSLPLGSKLHRFLQLQVFLKHAFLRFHVVHYDCFHFQKSSVGCNDSARNWEGIFRLQSRLLDDNSLHFGSCLWFNNNSFLHLPSLADQEPIHNNWVLWKEGEWRAVQTKVPLQPWVAKKLPKYPGIQPTPLVEPLLLWGAQRQRFIFWNSRWPQRKNDRRPPSRVSFGHARVKASSNLTLKPVI